VKSIRRPYFGIHASAATKDDFINRESILNEMISTLADEKTRRGALDGIL